MRPNWLTGVVNRIIEYSVMGGLLEEASNQMWRILSYCKVLQLLLMFLAGQKNERRNHWRQRNEWKQSTASHGVCTSPVRRSWKVIRQQSQRHSTVLREQRTFTGDSMWYGVQIIKSWCYSENITPAKVTAALSAVGNFGWGSEVQWQDTPPRHIRQRHFTVVKQLTTL